MSYRVSILLGALIFTVIACSPDTPSGDLWDGDVSGLAGVWRARDLEPQGRPYLLLDLSTVYRVVVETPTQAIEVDRGSYSVEDGSLIRVTTRNMDPTLVGHRSLNGIYRVTWSELVLEPSEAAGRQRFYDRVDAAPVYRELP